MKKLTANGKTFDVNYTLPQGKGTGLAISLSSDEPLSAIAAAFEGCQSMKATHDDKPGVTELYDGYTTLTGISRLESGAVRVVLARDK